MCIDCLTDSAHEMPSFIFPKKNNKKKTTAHYMLQFFLVLLELSIKMSISALRFKTERTGVLFAQARGRGMGL